MQDLRFDNRKEAGTMLAEKLQEYRDSEAVILAVPRGGVPIGYELAKTLNLPLDIILSKKIGHPHNPEFAIGSVSLENIVADKYPGVSEEYIKKQTEKIRKELRNKFDYYAEVRPNYDIQEKTAILTDDGIATGNTLLVTTELLRSRGAKKIVIAVPVLPLDRVESVAEIADELIYVFAPKYYPGVGLFYSDFAQVKDEEAKEMLYAINGINKLNTVKE
jgi:putative phosphoribosyl transferase